MEQCVVGLERHNLAELEVVERLAAKLGAEAFEAEVSLLSRLHKVNPECVIKSIRRFVHPSLIGMSVEPFLVLQRLADELVEREPALLKRPSFRCRNDHATALPLELWFAIVRHARAHYDPAESDAAFLVARLREGFTSEQAFHALIASKRSD
jgi:hypothetical protein